MAVKKFTKFTSEFWSGEMGKKVLDLGPMATVLAAYLVTNSHANYICLYRIPVEYMAIDLRQSVKQVKKSLADLQSIGYVKYSNENEMVWVVFGAEAHLGRMKEKDKQCKMVVNEFDALPESTPFLDEFESYYENIFHIRLTRENMSRGRIGYGSSCASHAETDAIQDVDDLDV